MAGQIGMEQTEIRFRLMIRTSPLASLTGLLALATDLLTEASEKRAQVITHEPFHFNVGNTGALV